VTPLLLVDVLDHAVLRADGAIALVHKQRTVTYGELDGYANALAFALERRGIGPGSRVAILLEGAEELIAFWAIAKAGAIGVPLVPEGASELAAALREVDARALLVDAGVAPKFHHAVARAPQLSVVIVRGRDADVDATGSAAYVSYETALADEDPLSRPTLRRIDLDDAWLETDEDGQLYALSHRVLLSRGATLVRGIGIETIDSVAGTAFAEVAVACALAGACFRVSGEQPREGGRSLWICSEDDDAPPPTGSTSVVLYAPMACGPVALMMQTNDPAHVLPNVDVRVVDDAGEVVPSKVVGEIAVRSSNVIAGASELVVDAPDGKSPGVSVEGYFRTGDSGMLDDVGALYVL
jgi:acyl-CoA synthetase (AMP-forming)/AMP-acid ligase II